MIPWKHIHSGVGLAREYRQSVGVFHESASIREGDARQMLRDLGGPVDFALIDGWPDGRNPSLAREVIEIVAPQIRRGGYVVNDNAEPDFLEFVRDPANGFISVSLPLKGGTELCVKVS
jgi:predicted O-methyltransferase YrrM